MALSNRAKAKRAIEAKKKNNPTTLFDIKFTDNITNKTRNVSFLRKEDIQIFKEQAKDGKIKITGKRETKNGFV